MSEEETTKTRAAWEPVTPRGVAAFAYASTGRLFLLQFLVALGVALTVVWFMAVAWFPTVRMAIQHLPDEGEIRGGQLRWRGGEPRLLAEGNFLAFSVDLEHSGEIRSPAHIEIELGRTSLYFRSLLGYSEVRYPPDWIVAANREKLGPWWGAWEPAILAMTALGVIVWLLVTWFVLATVYALPLWLFIFFVNRDLGLGQCWRLAGAALLPAALLMLLGIVLYGSGVVDVVGLAFIAVGHLILGWIYLFVVPLFLRPVTTGKLKNPFTARPA